jgi:hypothetical protein
VRTRILESIIFSRLASLALYWGSCRPHRFCQSHHFPFIQWLAVVLQMCHDSVVHRAIPDYI